MPCSYQDSPLSEQEDSNDADVMEQGQDQCPDKVLQNIDKLLSSEKPKEAEFKLERKNSEEMAASTTSTFGSADESPKVEQLSVDEKLCFPEESNYLDFLPGLLDSSEE